MNQPELVAEVERTLTTYSDAWEGYDEEVLDLGSVIARWNGQGGWAFARIAGQDIDVQLDRLIDQVEGQGRRYLWLVSPSTQPKDLADRLTVRGFTRVHDWDGLILEDLSIPFIVNPDVTVETLTSDSMPELVDMLANRGDTSDFGGIDREGITHRLQRYLGQEPRESLILLGRLDGRVVTYTATRFESNGTAYLRSGLTLPDTRGRGVYVSVLAERLRHAREAGCTRAIVQAITETSSPILQKRGFRRVCGLSAYSRPGASTH